MRDILKRTYINKTIVLRPLTVVILYNKHYTVTTWSYYVSIEMLLVCYVSLCIQVYLPVINYRNIVFTFQFNVNLMKIRKIMSILALINQKFKLLFRQN